MFFGRPAVFASLSPSRQFPFGLHILNWLNRLRCLSLPDKDSLFATKATTISNNDAAPMIYLPHHAFDHPQDIVRLVTARSYPPGSAPDQINAPHRITKLYERQTRCNGSIEICR